MMANRINLLFLLSLIIILAGEGQSYIYSRLKNDITHQRQSPPSYKEYAKMARYIVHKSNWTALGTISTSKEIRGFPMVNVISIADSPINSKSTGNIYFFLTTLDFTGQDLAVNNQLTMLLSMDQDLYCSSQNIDPMEPTCARIMLSGNAIKLSENDAEFYFGNASMFSRHPAAKNWLKAHDFFLCKLLIKQVVVLDYYGGPHLVAIKDYYNANPETYNTYAVPTKSKNQYTVLPQNNFGAVEKLTIRIKKNTRIINIQEF